jgi:nicotinamidase-related amidase
MRVGEHSMGGHGLNLNGRLALLTVECQTAILDPDLAQFKSLAEAVVARRVLPRIAALAQLCRAAQIPVIHCTLRTEPQTTPVRAVCLLQRLMHGMPLLRRENPLSGLHPDLGIHSGDIVCDRSHGVTAFHDSGLEAMLRALGIETILLTGVSTDLAIPGTTIEAINRMFKVIVPEDCTAGSSLSVHNHAVGHLLPLIATVTCSDAVAQHLAGPK